MMSTADKDLVAAFAKGDTSLRAQAVEIHRRNIPLIGVRGNIYQKFMAEVDHPAPDLFLRNEYRQKLLDDHARPLSSAPAANAARSGFLSTLLRRVRTASVGF